MKLKASDVLAALQAADSTAWNLYTKGWSESSDAELQDLMQYIGQLTHDEDIIDEIVRTMPNRDNPRVLAAWRDPALRKWLIEKAQQTQITFTVKPDISRFNRYTNDGKPNGANDHEIIQDIIKETKLLMVDTVPYLYNGHCYTPDLTGAQIKGMIRDRLEVKQSNIITRVYNLLHAFPELEVHIGEMNQYPARWVCFENGFYDPVARTMIPHDPKYRAVNMVPHRFDPDAKPSGNEVDSWLSLVAHEPDEREMLLQYLGYCMTRDTGQQKLLLLIGEGGSGKSVIISVINACVGAANVSNISLHQLSQKFYAFNMVGKLLNSCGDLDLAIIESSGEFKKLTGEDPIMAERKGCDPFTYKSYARLLFSANEAPTVKGERTNGFYRRFLILPVYGKHKIVPHYEDRLLAEKDHLLHLAMDALGRMYGTGKIVESASSVEAVQQMRRDSDTVQAWLDENTVEDASAVMNRVALFDNYEVYCRNEGRIPLSANAFYKALASKHIRFSDGQKRHGGQIIRACYGIKLV